jgi:hypothetical protein
VAKGADTKRGDFDSALGTETETQQKSPPQIEDFFDMKRRVEMLTES